ncbi:MAG: cytochrome c biogenesis CcdA family protein [Acidimicrobiales bacterium]
MSEYLQAFLLGNGAILGNVCMLPLYPGLFVMFANQATNPRAKRMLPALGVLVLAGVLSLMVVLGGVLYLLSTAFSEILDYVLPVLYALVFLLGVAMLAGRNPFARLATTNAPITGNPALTAYLYGVMLGPMTLPCTGPLVLSAFTIGGVVGTGGLVDGLTYFLFFGLGFGWPLVALPLLAAPVQRRVTGFLTRHHRGIGLVSGGLLVAIAIIGLREDVLPALT